MLKYVMKRLLLMIPVIVGISFILFVIMDLTPGRPARSMLGEYARQEDVDAQRKLGLNDPFAVRYGRYLAGAIRGDFGKSYRTISSRWFRRSSRASATMKVAFLAIVFAMLIGIPWA